MSSLRLLLLCAAWITVVAGEPLLFQQFRRPVSPALSPVGRDLLTEASVGHILLNSPRNARLIATKPVIPAIADRLIDNYTEIYDKVVDTFRCDGLAYGYYADVDNNCHIFHVCLPLRQLFPGNFTEDITYQFSFICPKFTLFSQDSMTCGWADEVVPCQYAKELYWLNKNFFRILTVVDPDGTVKEEYAKVNDPLP